MKKVLSIVLSLAMVICMMPTMAFAASDAAYNDIAGTKCEAAVEELSSLGIVDGYEDGSYQPEKIVTRAEMAKLIVTALGLAPEGGSTSFTDMDAAKWAIPYVGYAESLGIINGYGDGKFGPNDTVTYDQSITMIVRALGYTPNCNEMQGTWPAVYIQKANELKILKDVNKSGSNGANRGDVAIMLDNAITVQMVYANNEGQTIQKKDKNGADVTMKKTLTEDSDAGYETLTAVEALGAAKNVMDFIGAAGKVVTNDDNKVVSVADVKTTFLTGKLNSAATKFDVDGTKYDMNASLKALDPETGKAVAAGSVNYYINAQTPTTLGAISDIVTNTSITLACTVEGKTITGVYSVQEWNVNAAAQMNETYLTQLSKNDKLISKSFKKNNDAKIDTRYFSLLGVDSLDQIADKNIVYVYTQGATGNVVKVEVGTEVVTGTVEKVGSDFVTINGKDYDLSGESGADYSDAQTVDNEVIAYLDYNGDIYKAELESGTAGEYAYVVDSTEYKKGLGNTTQIKMMSGNGMSTVKVNTSKVTETAYSTTAGITRAAIFKYQLNSDGEFKMITDAAVSGLAAKKVTAKGYCDNYAIKDSAVIIAAPTTGAAWDKTKTSSDDFKVIKKSDILDKSIPMCQYILEKNEIVFMVVSMDAASDDLYGVVEKTWTGKDGVTGLKFYKGSEAVEGETEDSVTTGVSLYKITSRTDGKYGFTGVTTGASLSAASGTAIEATASAISGTKISKSDNTFVGNLASDAVIYIWKAGDKKVSTGVVADIIDSTNKSVTVYSVAKPDDDNAGLIDYVIITRA